MPLVPLVDREEHVNLDEHQQTDDNQIEAVAQLAPVLLPAKDHELEHQLDNVDEREDWLHRLEDRDAAAVVVHLELGLHHDQHAVDEDHHIHRPLEHAVAHQPAEGELRTPAQEERAARLRRELAVALRVDGDRLTVLVLDRAVERGVVELELDVRDELGEHRGVNAVGGVLGEHRQPVRRALDARHLRERETE